VSRQSPAQATEGLGALLQLALLRPTRLAGPTASLAVMLLQTLESRGGARGDGANAALRRVRGWLGDLSLRGGSAEQTTVVRGVMEGESMYGA
jgi:hypothetical protein